MASLVVEADEALHMNLCSLQIKYERKRETIVSQSAWRSGFVSMGHISNTVAQLGFNEMPITGEANSTENLQAALDAQDYHLFLSEMI